jgi:hypothetical protein
MSFEIFSICFYSDRVHGIFVGITALLAAAAAMGKAIAPAHFVLGRDPEKLALGLDPRVDFRFSEKIMLQLEFQTLIRLWPGRMRVWVNGASYGDLPPVTAIRLYP